jgi:hypothetical protein
MAPIEKANGEDESSSIDGDPNIQQISRRTHTFRRRITTTIRGRRLTEHDDNDNNITVVGKEWEPKHQEEEEQQRREAVSSISFLCGITAGVFQAGIFNPFDRALYLSITNEVPFLRHENFRNPYTGFLQSVGHRALSSGLYYPLENFFCSFLVPSHSHPNECEEIMRQNPGMIHLHPALANFLAGTFAGTTNALVRNLYLVTCTINYENKN